MKRLLIFTPIVWFALLGAFVVAFNLGFFHSQIENFLAEKTSAKVKLGSTTLIPKWPVAVEFGETSLEGPGATLSWRTFRLELASVTPPYKVTVTLVEPKFDLMGEISYTKKDGAAQAGKGEASGSATPIQLAVVVNDGDFKFPEVHIKSLNLNFDQKLLLKSAAKIHAQAFVQAKMLPVSLPFSIDTDNLTLTTESVKSSDLKIFFGGLQATASGASLLNEGRHRWKAAISAPDLSKLPKPPMNIPATDWRGAVEVKAEVIKENAEKPWSVEGDIKAEKVSANVKYQLDKLLVQGPFSVELQSHFLYANSVPVISNFTGSVDLTPAHVVYQDLLRKAPNVPLKATIAAHGDLNSLQLQNLELQFWKFSGKASGDAKLKAPYPSSIRFDVPSFSMEGADKVILALGRSPVTGEVAASGTFKGDLSKASEAHLQLDILKLKDFAAEVDYDKPGVLKAKGPIKVSVEGKIEIDKMDLKQADLKGRANLSEAAVVAGPLRKEAKQILTADFQARNAGDTLDVQNLSVDSFVGRLKVTGKVTKPFDPTVKLKIELQPLNLSELRIALPEWREKIPKGSLSGTVNVAGRMDSARPWNDWPLDVDGSLRAMIPEYAMQAGASPPAAPAPGKQSPLKMAGKSNDAFLPAGHLTNRLKMKIVADIETFKKEKLTLKGVHTDGMVGASHFKGGTDIKEIFGGTVNVSGLDVPLTDARPAIQGVVKWSNLVTEDAIGFAKPEYREFATGRMAGTTEFLTYLPSDEEFMPFLKAKGEVNMSPVTLNTVRVGQMINDLAKQLPMVKMSPAKLDPLKGTLKAVFNMQKQTLQIDSLEAKDVDNSELNLKGKVSVPGMQGDFAGTFFWATPQVQGCLLEGNSDASGRMIIPVAIKGDLMHPGLSSLSDLISKLAGKALNCEQKKLVERVKKEGTKQLEDEVKKKLKGLFGQ